MSKSRSRGSRGDGGSWSEAEKAAVWRKGDIIAGHDPRIWRSDKCGSKIKWDQYGTLGIYGWEIDHIKPVSRGGGDELSNLQPLHWSNNRSKGDDYPHWRCAS
ncbi:HNH endonuclease [Blastopirellula marina]|uniref:HNH endonuclease n=1 Tax=Blastopirellula marina TaxID=124 RepID=A0A2S8F133_9BACT|nr:HNH endonuclease [Blastopirellula marina]RCS43500.1 HNH endonuclease [Bremerella cremea]